MGRQIDDVKKHFGPLKDKTFKNALAHRIGEDFPRIGGERIRLVCAEMVLEVIEQHLRPKEYLKHGQIVWMGVSIDDPPARNKRIANTDLIPAILTLSSPDDIEMILQRKSKMKRLEDKAVRLCHEAYEQGCLLSGCDLAEILNISDSYVATLLAEHERTTGKLIPRRANIHDVGSGLTHKRIICLKRYKEGKEPHQIAQETYHTIDAVDRYLGQYDRVRHCKLQGMSPQEIAYTLKCSDSLVNEYLKIDKELNEKNI